MDTYMIYRKYEEEKNKLQELCLSREEYEEAIKRLTESLKI